MPSKHNIKSKSKSTAPSGVIVTKTVEDLGNTPAHNKQNVTNGVDRHEMIAMAAYYRSQKRDFNRGDEIQDWLEAESEVDGLI